MAKINEKPRISVNKLCEYTDCEKATRRKKIIFGAKYPGDSPSVPLYREARTSISNYLVNNFDKDDISNCLKSNKKRAADPTVSKWHKDDANNSIKALEMMDKEQCPDFEGCQLELLDAKSKYLNIEGVNISVYPDILIRRNNKVVGALKIHISKNNLLSEKARENVGLLIHQFLEEFYADEIEKLDKSLCISLDVFAQEYSTCPGAFKRRLGYITSACEEIESRWDKL